MMRTYRDIAKEMLELRDMVCELTEERDTLRATVAKLTEKNDRQANTIGLLDKKVTKLTEERDALQKEIDRWRSHDWEGKIIEAVTAGQEQLRENDQLRAQLAERDGMVAALREFVEWLSRHGSLESESEDATTVVERYSTSELQHKDERIETLLADTAQAAADHDERVRAEEQQRIITELTDWVRRFAHVADPNTAAEVARQFDRAIAALSTAGKEET